jgi:glycolate oxidase iron-sulfur subunit
VAYGELIETYRLQLWRAPIQKAGVIRRVIDRLMLAVLPSVQRTRAMLELVRWGQVAGLFEFLSTANQWPEYTPSLAFAEVIQGLPKFTEGLPEHASPAGCEPRASVGLFTGCVSESIGGFVNRAAHRVLLRNGCAVHCPSTQLCCGALHYHSGDAESARRLARANIDAFRSCGTLEAIVVNAAGCGLMLKAYDRLLIHDASYREPARRLAQSIRDVHEFLVDLPLAPPASSTPYTVAYHDACHLSHGQRIREAPRKLLCAIPGLVLRELREADFCCGAAGSYCLTQPAMAGRLARRKLECVRATSADCLASGNIGCTLHLLQNAAACGHSLRIAHPVELLDEAYARERGKLQETSPSSSCIRAG